jgi:hypothetical protein
MPRRLGAFELREHRRNRQAGARALDEILRLWRSTRRSESRVIEGEVLRLEAGRLHRSRQLPRSVTTLGGMPARTPAECARDLQRHHSEYRAGRITVREHLEFAKQVWIEATRGGVADQLLDELVAGERDRTLASPPCPRCRTS